MNIKTQVRYTLELLKDRYPASYNMIVELDREEITVKKKCTVNTDKYYHVKARWELFYWWLAEGRKIQDVFNPSQFTDNQREFLISGTTPAEWDALIPPDDEDERFEEEADRLYDEEGW